MVKKPDAAARPSDVVPILPSLYPEAHHPPAPGDSLTHPQHAHGAPLHHTHSLHDLPPPPPSSSSSSFMQPAPSFPQLSNAAFPPPPLAPSSLPPPPIPGPIPPPLPSYPTLPPVDAVPGEEKTADPTAPTSSSSGSSTPGAPPADGAAGATPGEAGAEKKKRKKRKYVDKGIDAFRAALVQHLTEKATLTAVPAPPSSEPGAAADPAVLSPVPLTEEKRASWLADYRAKIADYSIAQLVQESVKYKFACGPYVILVPNWHALREALWLHMKKIGIQKAKRTVSTKEDLINLCLTGDHRVLTRSGWRSITRMQMGEEVLSFNVHTHAEEWKAVRAVTSHTVDPAKAQDTLYRMQGSGMDVIATRDHRMLLARLHPGSASSLQVGYETVGELLELSYAASSMSKATRFAHNHSRAVVRAGFNAQPAVKVVVPGLERVCQWWWDEDQQLGFLQFLGFWLADGHLSTVDGLVRVGQQKESCEWLQQLLDRVFPRSWYGIEQPQTAGASVYTIRCAPLYDYLRPMAVGPIGYNPRDPAAVRSYPDFTKDEGLAAKEQQSADHEPDNGIGGASTWTEDAMLAPFSAGEGVDAARCVEEDAEVAATYVGDVDPALKRCLGDAAQIASVYSRLSRQQAIALLDGFCRADGVAATVLYDGSGEPTGQWRCSHSSFPLIDHLQLIGQLAGAAVDLHLQAKADTSHTIDGRTVGHCVDHWALHFSFNRSARGIPFPAAPLAQPVDVSSDIDERGYYGHEDDGRVYCIQVQDNANFLTQRLSTKRLQGGAVGVRAQSIFIGNCIADNIQFDFSGHVKDAQSHGNKKEHQQQKQRLLQQQQQQALQAGGGAPPPPPAMPDGTAVPKAEGRGAGGTGLSSNSNIIAEVDGSSSSSSSKSSGHSATEVIGLINSLPPPELQQFSTWWSTAAPRLSGGLAAPPAAGQQAPPPTHSPQLLGSQPTSSAFSPTSAGAAAVLSLHQGGPGQDSPAARAQGTASHKKGGMD